MAYGKLEEQSAYGIYAFSCFYNNLTLIASHPLERFKVSVQLSLAASQMSILKPILVGANNSIFRGFFPCALRQNVKILHRTALMTVLPQWIDGYHFNVIFSSVLKGFIASVVDTLMISPLENIKTHQMKSSAKTSLMQAVKCIYNQNRFKGFFFGTNVTIVKSLSSWICFFIGYQITEDKRECDNILATLFWATAITLPITTVTMPLDTIKSRRQALLCPNNESSVASAKRLINDFGIFTLWRGFPFRLLQESLSTAAGYVILDKIQRLQS